MLNANIIQKMRAQLLLCAWVLLTSCATVPSERKAGLWNLKALSSPPPVTWGASDGLVQELYYQGEPFNGKATQIFAYLGRPKVKTNTRKPAIILVHGGGGKAFKAWADHWAQRGYVALAMDLAGNGPAGRLPNGGPDQDDKTKFRKFSEADAKEMWTYHAVSAVVLGHSLVRSLPDVDPQRTGLTGISWGGYLTCIAAAIDPRFKVSVPVYGCGYLGDNSVWTDRSFATMNPEDRALWLRLFDPSQYLENVSAPVLFVNGTTDFAYPLDSYKKSYQLVPERLRNISVAVNRPHGHIWTFPEVDGFVDSALLKNETLPKITKLNVTAGTLIGTISQPVKPKEALLCYTSDSGPWQKRKWHTSPAVVSRGSISSALPKDRPIVAFLSIKDDRGYHVSSEHLELR